MKYKTKILQFGNNTGIEITEQQLEQLGGGKRPLVKVQLNGYTYRGAVGKMGNKFLISLSAENRSNAGVKGGDQVVVTVNLDTEPRTVEIPPPLQQVFRKNKVAKAAFDQLAPSKKKAIVLSITTAKTQETLMRRVGKAIESLV